MVIYANVADLRVAALADDIRTGALDLNLQGKGGAAGEYKNCYGVTHRYERVTYEQVLYPNIGLIRLSQTHLGTEIISHELVHAVLWAMRLKYGTTSTGRDKLKMSWREEKLAYMYGATFRTLNLILHKKGFWS